jgi:hypothetical protein
LNIGLQHHALARAAVGHIRTNEKKDHVGVWTLGDTHLPTSPHTNEQLSGHQSAQKYHSDIAIQYYHAAIPINQIVALELPSSASTHQHSLRGSSRLASRNDQVLSSLPLIT